MHIMYELDSELKFPAFRQLDQALVMPDLFRHVVDLIRPAKNKVADEREVFIEGNLVKAKRISDSERSEEGIIPPEWTLIKRSPDGGETVLAKGVMDYLLLDSGVILYSDGRFVKRLSGGKTETVCRIDLAHCIAVTE